MAKKQDKNLTRDQAEKNTNFEKDLFNIRFKKINNQVENPANIMKLEKIY